MNLTNKSLVVVGTAAAAPIVLGYGAGTNARRLAFVGGLGAAALYALTGSKTAGLVAVGAGASWAAMTIAGAVNSTL